jgi:D-alanyl-D-alanine endopeptidase (penicillin-binding protein 7)
MHRTTPWRVVVFLLASLVSTSAAGQTTKATASKPASQKAASPAKASSKPAASRSRAPRRATAKAQANAREIANSVIPRYKVDAAGDLVPDLRAAAAIIWNPSTNQVLWEENSNSERSIASITKVMTAVVFLENNPDLSETVTVLSSDVYRASTTYLKAKDRLTTGDLLHLLLISSDNAAARVLARVSPSGSAGFIDRMNQKAREMGLTSTRYADTSGLLSDNVSSALDMARLITYASADDRIGAVMRLREHTINAGRRVIHVRSTNQLLGRTDVEVRAGKTGFISKAGYCLATLLRLPQGGQQVAVVVLGARSNAGRFLETQNLFSWLSNKAASIFATQTPAVNHQE